MAEENRQYDLIKLAQSAVGFQEVTSRWWNVFAWISPFVTTSQLLSTIVNFFFFESGIYWTHLRWFWRGIWYRKHASGAWLCWQSAPEPAEASPRASAPVLMRNGHFENEALDAELVKSPQCRTSPLRLRGKMDLPGYCSCFLISWDIFISGLVLLSVSFLNSGDLFLISFCWL